MDITSLVKSAHKGDRLSFVKLVEPKREQLYRIAFSYLHNNEDSMDVLQDTMVRALTSLHTLKNPELFYSWLTRILINLCCTQLKKSRRLLRMPQFDKYPQPVDGHVQLVDEKLDLFRSMGALDEKYRQVLILKYMGDYTLREISEIIKCPIGTVKSRLNYGLTELRKEHDGGDPK